MVANIFRDLNVTSRKITTPFKLLAFMLYSTPFVTIVFFFHNYLETKNNGKKEQGSTKD